MNREKFRKLINKCEQLLIKAHDERSRGIYEKCAVGVCDVLSDVFYRYSAEVSMMYLFQDLFAPSKRTNKYAYWLGRTRGSKLQMEKVLNKRLEYLRMFEGYVLENYIYRQIK